MGRELQFNPANAVSSQLRQWGRTSLVKRTGLETMMKKVRPIKSRRNQSAKVNEQLEIFRKQTEARGRIGQAAYDAQEITTKNAIDAIRDRLTIIATGNIRVFPDGKRNPSVSVTISTDLVDQNILFFATEIVKDLAMMDMRIENYEFPTVYCAECQEKLTPR